MVHFHTFGCDVCLLQIILLHLILCSGYVQKLVVIIEDYRLLLLTEIKCPYCGKIQTQKPQKTWKYGTAVNVSRYKCGCGKLFNYYNSSEKTWTIPRQP